MISDRITPRWGSIFLLLFVCASGVSAEVLETYPEGVLNWTRGWVEAHGESGVEPGKIDGSLNLATNNARHNLYKVLLAVTIDAESSVLDLGSDNHLFTAGIHELVGQANIIEPVDYITDGTVRVHIRLSIYDGFSQLVLPKEVRQIESISTVTPVSKGNPDTPETNPPTRENEADPVSGLIVDARKIVLQPSLVLRLMDESGKEVYGPEFVSRENVVQLGMCTYHSSMDTVGGEKRVSPNALVVRGLRSSGANRCDIVISNTDAAKIRSTPELLPSLRKCRVIVVTGNR